MTVLLGVEAGGRLARAALLAAGLAAAGPAAASGGVPVRVRILKASRQGPPAIDRRLLDLQPVLASVAYVRWDLLGESYLDLATGKPAQVPLPDGSRLEVTVLGVGKDTVTFQVRAPAHRTQSRLTISRDKRIVHQVTAEKGGEAYFVTIRPWP